ncbi:MgtC/SapB family protein [Niabella sp. 22666]|uniref:MgtC/SapB family protein n=1 Tax=Niabella sp. 22666 TaxID=3453954 RepID=UPI003F84D216
MDYELLSRLLLAALWGGIVGAEREYRSKSAGFRTIIMISMGSCFFTMMSTLIGGGSNPDRIASNIVTGIGFLGAGVIFRGDNRVNGITTAATIWAVAAVGMGIGAGYYFVAACASFLILFVLAALPYIEKLIDNSNQNRLYVIQYFFEKNAKKKLEQLFHNSELKFKLTKQIKEDGLMTTHWQVRGKADQHNAIVTSLESDDTIKRFEY